MNCNSSARFMFSSCLASKCRTAFFSWLKTCAEMRQRHDLLILALCRTTAWLEVSQTVCLVFRRKKKHISSQQLSEIKQPKLHFHFKKKTIGQFITVQTCQKAKFERFSQQKQKRVCVKGEYLICTIIFQLKHTCLNICFFTCGSSSSSVFSHFILLYDFRHKPPS